MANKEPNRFSIDEKDIRNTPIVRIDWEDACAFSGRFRVDGTDIDWSDTYWDGSTGSLLCRVVTVGFLVRESKRAVTVCTSIFTSSKRVAELMTIPRKWIKKITKIRAVK